MQRSTVLATPILLVLAGCGGGGTASSPIQTPTPTPPPPPNVVLILVDDLGWGDLSSYGSTIQTPNIDRLGTEGVRFTNFYANPVCAPSRASLMTGRWAVRAGVPWNPPVRLNSGEITVADALKGLGYATSMVGKWHLGWVPADFPLHHGFDSYYGQIAEEDQNGGAFYRGDAPTDNPADVVRVFETTRRYTQEAVSIIRAHSDRPFFLYVAPRDPHLPLWADYQDMVKELDRGVGQILQALRDTGLDNNTLVIFTSDNGPPDEVGSTGPFSGRKGGIGEGSVRMPALARWPARIPGGRTIDQPVANLDIFPTLVALAGGKVPSDHVYDGVDISTILTGERTTLTGPGIDNGREFLYWSSTRATAIRSGKWKFVRKYSNDSVAALHDLDVDPSEHENLCPQHPDLCQQLNERIDQLSAGL